MKKMFLLLIFIKAYCLFGQYNIESFSIKGIDVSLYQGKIDWGKIAKQNIKFVFIKATEGGTYRDSLFMQNWKGCSSNGIKKSAYHYFSFCSAGSKQAKNYINTVPIDSAILNPVVDVELKGKCNETKSPSHDELVKQLREFINLVEKHYGKKVMIYCGYDCYQKYIMGEFTENPLWIRDYEKYPLLQDDRKPLFWQYSEKGKLNGINGFIDLNVFIGPEDEFGK